jgi:ElaA protein
MHPEFHTTLDWRWRAFNTLSVFELQAIHRVRQQVFVLEQQCAFVDADSVDAHSHHLAAWATTELTFTPELPWAYARVVSPGVKYAEPSIGRVLTAQAARGSGLGHELLRRVLAHCAHIYPGQNLRISAQSRLERFYLDHGFTVVGSPYLEDGILHTEMLRVA